MLEFVRISGRDNILHTAAELRIATGKAVLLMPGWGEQQTIADPFNPPRHVRKDREGRIQPRATVAFDTAYDPALFDAAAMTGLTFMLDRPGGTHIAQLPGNRHFIDLMSPEPDALLQGTGQVMLVGGAGWVGENADLTLGKPARFVMTEELKRRGGPVILGIGSVSLGDLALPVRREARPDMVHYQRPQPIPF